MREIFSECYEFVGVDEIDAAIDEEVPDAFFIGGSPEADFRAAGVGLIDECYETVLLECRDPAFASPGHEAGVFAAGGHEEIGGFGLWVDAVDLFEIGVDEEIAGGLCFETADGAMACDDEGEIADDEFTAVPAGEEGFVLCDDLVECVEGPVAAGFEVDHEDDGIVAGDAFGVGDDISFEDGAEVEIFDGPLFPEYGRVVGNYESGAAEIYIGFDMGESIFEGVEEGTFMPIVIMSVCVRQREVLGEGELAGD